MDTNKVRTQNLIVLILLLLSITVSVVPTNGVQAGSNGQQIYFSCKNYIQSVPAMNYVIIRGTNQAGQSVEWRGWARFESENWSTYVFTQGWWWVGKVRIHWWVRSNNHWYSAVFYVPQQSSFNTANLNCGNY
jgi:hypothetical protein